MKKMLSTLLTLSLYTTISAMNPNQPLSDLEKTLIAAAQAGTTNIIKDKLDQVDPNFQDPDNGNTLLHYAAEAGQLGVVNFLLNSQKVNANIQNNDGDTALHSAVKSNHPDVIKYIAQKQYKTKADWKADVNIQNNDGDTPLHLAAFGANPLVVAACFSVANWKPLDNNKGNKPIHLLAQSKNTPRNVKDSLDQFIKFHKENVYTITNKAGNNVLSYAVELNNAALVAYLFQDAPLGLTLDQINGFLKILNNNKRSALHIAAIVGNPVLIRAIIAKIQELAFKKKLRLTVEQYLNMQDVDGDTAVMLAAEYGHSDAVSALLIVVGAAGKPLSNLNLANKNGYVALALAILNDHERVVKIILDFLKQILSEKEFAEIVKNSVEAAASLGHKKLAEFIEGYSGKPRRKYSINDLKELNATLSGLSKNR